MPSDHLTPEERAEGERRWNAYCEASGKTPIAKAVLDWYDWIDAHAEKIFAALAAARDAELDERR